jgi:hypothetical protein
MRGELRRLRRIAARMGVCPTHGTKLACGLCDFQWTGTLQELRELEPLARRLDPYWDTLTPSGHICRQHGLPLWCGPCYQAEAAQIDVPDDLFTPNEVGRYCDLVRLLQPRRDDHGESRAPTHPLGNVSDPR